MFDMARALTAPLSIHTVSWELLMAKLKNHYTPSPSKIARWHAFFHRNQTDGEYINYYMASLRSAALHCEFKDLDDALLDWLVCGVRNLRLQRRLLAKPEPTFQTMLDMADMSTQSLAMIQRTLPLTTDNKTTAPVQSSVHQGDVSAESEPEDDEEINCFNEAKKKSWPRGKNPPKVFCMGCDGNHTRAVCNFKNASANVVAGRDI